MAVVQKVSWPYVGERHRPPLDLAATRRALGRDAATSPWQARPVDLHPPYGCAMVAGFAHAPLTKRTCASLTVVALVSTAIASLCVSLCNAKAFIPFQWDPHIRVYHQTCLYHVAFTNSSELCVGVLLWHHAGRHIERMLGSRKYAVALVLLAALHSLGSLAWGAAANYVAPSLPARLKTQRLEAGYLPAGQVGLLTALSVLYFAYTPPLWSILLGDWECTDRILVAGCTLLVRLFILQQLASSQPPYSMVSALLGVAAAYVYMARFPLLGSLSKLQVPTSLAARAQRTFGPLVGSTRLPARPSHAQYHRTAL